MKVLIFISLLLIPITANTQSSREKKMEKKYHGLPDSLYLTSTVLVIVDVLDEEIAECQEKFEKVFRGNVLTISESKFNETDYPIEEYPIVVSSDYNSTHRVTTTRQATNGVKSSQTEIKDVYVVLALDRDSKKSYFKAHPGKIDSITRFLWLWSKKVRYYEKKSRKK